MNKKQTSEELLKQDSVSYLAWQLEVATKELKEENDRAELKQKARDLADLRAWLKDLPNRNWREANE
mgnify:CR=1 FL=1|tara:strand:- start:2584 stop:2784 length:201 start_codon:yes stop_codon:yes gene_type:complete